MGVRVAEVEADADLMSIAHLLDHTATVYRPADTLGALRTNIRGYAAVASGVEMGVRRPAALYAEIGPGVGPLGQRIIYADVGLDVAARDVIDLITGPDAPGRWEVDEQPTSPRGHHIELRCRAFTGKLPGDA